MSKLMPIHFQSWIEENRHLLKPPVGNKVVYEDTEFIIMVVGGPNQRTDFHIDPAEEFFYQLEGTMTLRVREGDPEGGKLRDIRIGAGEIMLLPANVPHSPQREANSVGLVVERTRNPGELDGMAWYCEQCATELYSERFQLVDITKDFPPVFDRYYSRPENRTCSKCDWVMPERENGSASK